MERNGGVIAGGSELLSFLHASSLDGVTGMTLNNDFEK